MENEMTFASWRGSEKAISEIEKEIFPKDCWSEASIKESVDFPLFFGEVLLQSCGVVGYYGMNIIAGEGYIANIGVAKKHQQKGVGNLLLKRLIKMCDEKECFEITLEVRVSNFPAIALYEKFNFKIEGVRKGFYRDGEDAYVMWKRK